jgi:nucleotide-binding universal stress UspA family protein
MKILLPVVQSDYTERNLDRVCDLVKKLDAELTLLHVVAMSLGLARNSSMRQKARSRKWE